jgi:hypothetical protein
MIWKGSRVSAVSKEMIVGAVAELARLRLGRLDHIRETMLASIQLEREKIAEMYTGAQEDFADCLADDHHFLYEAEEMVGGLLLVGLYSAVEHFTKQLLRHRYPPNKVKQCYKIEGLQEALAKDCDVNLSVMPEYAAIDDLRKRNNAVKHGGGSREPSLPAYERLREAVVPYLERIALVIVP